MSTLIQDLRLALRTLRKDPGYAAIAIAVLSLGIGGVTAIFSAVNGLLLRALPYPEAERIVQVWETDRSQEQLEGPVSPLNLEDWRESSRSFEALAGYAYNAPTLSGEGAPRRVRALSVSTAFFAVFAAEAARGRGFVEGDEGQRVAVLSHGLWESHFGGDPGIVGRAITLDDEPYAVVGVMPAEVRFPRSAQLWIPLSIDRDRVSRGQHYLFAVGRLAGGTELAAATSEMEAIARRLAERYPDTNAGKGVRLVPLREQLVGGLRLRLLILSGAVALVLLIGCANVANLLLVRATTRRREVALRAALGATRGRLTRQFLVEAMLLALIAGGIGVALADLGLGLLLAASPFTLPLSEPLGLDLRVLGFTLIVSLATGVVFGLAPAWQASRPDASWALREAASTAGPRSQRLRRNLVSAEIALAVILLSGAGLLLRSFQRLTRVDPGFRADRVATMKLELTGVRYDAADVKAEVSRRVIERIRALPDVEAAGAVDDLPFSGSRSSTTFELEGRETSSGEQLFADVRSVTPGYLRSMSIPLLSGRDFDESDTGETRQVAIVNARFVRRFLEDVDPIGRRLLIGGPREGEMYGGPVWREIVGVIGDVRHDDLTAQPAAEIYTPFAQRPSSRLSLVARATGTAAGAVPSIRDALAEVLPDQPTFDVRTMEERVADSIAISRFNSGLLSAFAAIALLLAVFGIYGVVSYAVRQRTREIGIRIALGAHGGTVSRRVLAGSLIDIGVGLGIGLAGALVVSRALAGVLFEVSPHDPIVYVGVVLLFAAAGALASYGPARRAARVDPVEALRA